jgi:NitT/TauT family transport system substrate-binding protein
MKQSAQPNRRILCKAALLAIGVFLFVSASRALADDVVVTQWGVGMPGVEFAVGLDRGMFKAAGANVTGVLPAMGGGTSVRGTVAAGLGYGVVSLSAAIAAIQAGEDIKIVNSGVTSAADTVIATMPDSGFASLKDLEGKSIAITNPKGWAEMFVILALETQSIPAEKVRRVALGSISGGLTGLEKKAVQGAIVVEPVWSMRKSHYRLLFDGRNLPRIAQVVGIATGSLIRDHPDQLRAILQARRSAVQALYKDPGAAARSIAKYYRTVPVDVLTKVVTSLAADRYWSEGNFDLDAMRRMERALKLVGVGTSNGPIDFDHAIDRSFLPADLQK